MRTFGSEIKTTELYSPQRLELFENLEKVDSSFLNINVKDKVSFLLYGSEWVTSKSFDHDVLKFVINYIKETGCFNEPLFGQNQWFLVFYYCFIFFEYFFYYFDMY